MGMVTGNRNPQQIIIPSDLLIESSR